MWASNKDIKYLFTALAAVPVITIVAILYGKVLFLILWILCGNENLAVFMSFIGVLATALVGVILVAYRGIEGEWPWEPK